MTRRLLFFPIPAPDELLYSLLARYGRMAGGLPPRLVTAQVLGSENRAAAWDLPCHLGPLAQALQMPVSDLIGMHTLFPYYAAALLPRQRATLRRWMEGSRHGGSVHVISGVTASGVRATKRLRYCEQCANEDAREWGSPTWRRLHQCPGVIWCPIHRMPLTESTITVTGRSHKHLAAGLDVALKQGGRPLHIVDAERAQAIAEWTQKLLEGRGPSGATAWRNRHLEHLARAGWLTASRRVRWKSLLPALRTHLPVALWRSLGVRTDIEHPSHWLAGVLRSPRKSAHPLLQILAALLIEDVNECCDEIAAPPRHAARRRRKSAPKAARAVDRLAIAADRRAWSALALQYPAERTKSWRSRAPDLYARLYRHSRTWLLNWNAQHRLPKAVGHQRVNWAQRDSQFRLQLPLALRTLITDPEARRQRVTQASLLRQLGVPSLHPVQLAKMPLFRAALKDAAETKEAYLKRRLTDAAKEWVRRYAHPPKPWQLLRLANVRWPWPSRANRLAEAEIDRYLWGAHRGAKPQEVEHENQAVATRPAQPGSSGRRRVA